MRAKEFLNESLENFADQVKSSLGLKQFALIDKGDDIILSSLMIGKGNQGKGLGTKAMQSLIDYADKNNKRIILTPGTKSAIDGTTSRNRLVKFYKRFGFKESKGRNIDFVLGAGKMYREPKSSINESVSANDIVNSVKRIHRNERDFDDGDLIDRIYWFDDYEPSSINISNLNLSEFYVDDSLVKEIITKIKSSPNTMPPIIVDPYSGSIIDGIHRANAYAELGYKVIPALVGKTKSETYGEHQELDEYKVDNKRGLGSVPNNQEIDYMGFTVLMKPSTFLKLALPLSKPSSVDYIEKYLKDGGALGSPFLTVELPDEYKEGDFTQMAKVVGHEGRNRMLAIQKVDGDDPVEVQIFTRGDRQEFRARHLTPEIINHLNKGIRNESDTQVVTGRPLFRPM
jgi:hypothetical protein